MYYVHDETLLLFYFFINFYFFTIKLCKFTEALKTLSREQYPHVGELCCRFNNNERNSHLENVLKKNKLATSLHIKRTL